MFLCKIYYCTRHVIINFFSVVNSNPSHWPGEMGRAVVIPPEEEELRKEKFKLNQFNLLASDRIALNRTLPDVRAEG